MKDTLGLKTQRSSKVKRSPFGRCNPGRRRVSHGRLRETVRPADMVQCLKNRIGQWFVMSPHHRADFRNPTLVRELFRLERRCSSARWARG